MENIPSSLNYIIGTIAVIGSTLSSLFIPLFIGIFIGEKVNPTLHHYECTCDCPPVLTEFQALIFGTTYMILFSIVLYYTMRSLDISGCKRVVWCIILLILNGVSCFSAMGILCTEISG